MTEKNNIIFKLSSSGFTLIELLVVISIIGILSSFAIVSLNSARVKARDALRKGDMAQLRTALNLYYDDNLKYPTCAASEVAWDSAQPNFGNTDTDASQCYLDLKAELSPVNNPLVDRMPADPKNPTNNPAISPPHFYRYISHNDGEEYALIYYLEDSPTIPQVIRGY